MTSQSSQPASPPRTQKRLWWWPSAEVMVFSIAFLVFMLGMPQMLNVDGDLGRHLTIGNYILDTGKIPNSDIFSHTRYGDPLFPHEWLSEIFFALAYRAAGLNGVGWMTALILAGTYALLTAGMRLHGVRAYVSLAVGLLAFAGGMVHAVTRPHIFTLLWFTIFLLILEHERLQPGWRKLIWLPVLMVVWANLHGAFIAGLVLVGLYAAGYLLARQYRRATILLALLLVLLLAATLTPGGPAQIAHSFSYLGEDYLLEITNEYNSPDFHMPITWPFAGLLLLTILLGWRQQNRLEWTTLVPLLAWSAFGLYSARNIPLAVQVMALALAPQIDSWLADLSPVASKYLSRSDLAGKRAWGWMWAVLLVVLIIGAQAAGAIFDFYGRGNTFNPDFFPVAALQTLEGNLPEGEMFNEFGWGGFLLHHLWPEKLVFMDAQTDFYGAALTREQEIVADALPGWEEILERYAVDWIILPPTRPVAPWLDVSPYWEAIYRDPTTVIWVRAKP